MTFVTMHHKRFKYLDWQAYIYERDGVVYARMVEEKRVPYDLDYGPGVDLRKLMRSGNWELKEDPGVPDRCCNNSGDGVADPTC